MLDLQRWLYESATGALKAFAADADSGAFAASLAFAVLFGAVHALMPGHGKIALVSYYLGNPSRMLGGLVTSVVLILTHVGSAVVLVLAGFAILRHTLVGAGRAPALETASATMVGLVGVWLLVRSLRHSHSTDAANSKALAFAIGLVPCPLTTFIMVYASARGIISAGLALVTAMAAGMVITILIFVASSILFREQALNFLVGTEEFRERLGRGLEVASSFAVIAFAIWMYMQRGR